MTVDPARPGVILFDDIPMAGMIAGVRAKDIATACNAHDDLVAALNGLAAAVAEMAGRGRTFPPAVEKALDDAGAALAKVRP